MPETADVGVRERTLHRDIVLWSIRIVVEAGKLDPSSLGSVASCSG